MALVATNSIVQGEQVSLLFKPLFDMLCFVADIYEDSNRQNSHFKDRIRLVFANGTESNMLARSLATALSKHRQTSHHVLMTDDDWLMQFPCQMMTCSDPTMMLAQV